MSPAVLNLGFRPFYLLAALLAALSVPLWVAQYFGIVAPLGAVTAAEWHSHEMVFGFAVAVISGFLFTAVPNWTGQPTPTGAKLAVLAAIWLAARVCMVTGPSMLAAIVDSVFLPLVAWSIWRPLNATRDRNRFFVAILGVLWLAGVLFHLGAAGVVSMSPMAATRFGLAIVATIVAIMGGRVIPAFTRNAIPAARMRHVKRLDGAAILALAAALFGSVFGMHEIVLVPLAVLAAVLNAVRLWSWDPWSTRGRPIVWILHLSYAWMPVGLLLMALARAGIAGSDALAWHAIAMGAIGGMIIGMMTRTARGHTGRPLVADRPEVVAYVCVFCAAAARVFVPLVWPSVYAWALTVAAALWSLAFAIYFVVYWPWLTGPRADGRPG